MAHTLSLVLRIILDLALGQHLYFTDIGTGTLQRLSLNSGTPVPASRVSTLKRGLTKPMGIATLGDSSRHEVVLAANGVAYHATSAEMLFAPLALGNYGTSTVRSVISISSSQMILSLWGGTPGIFSYVTRPTARAVISYKASSPCADSLVWLSSNQILLWTDICEGSIKSVRLETGVLHWARTLVTNLVQPKGLAINHNYTKLYFVANHSIMLAEVTVERRQANANLLLSNFKAVVDAGLFAPGGLALDACRFGGGSIRKIYWSDACAGTIQRSNLDGSDIEEVMGGLKGPLALSLLCSSVTSTTTRTSRAFAQNSTGTTSILGTHTDASTSTRLLTEIATTSRMAPPAAPAPPTSTAAATSTINSITINVSTSVKSPGIAISTTSINVTTTTNTSAMQCPVCQVPALGSHAIDLHNITSVSWVKSANTTNSSDNIFSSSTVPIALVAVTNASHAQNSTVVPNTTSLSMITNQTQATNTSRPNISGTISNFSSASWSITSVRAAVSKMIDFNMTNATFRSVTAGENTTNETKLTNATLTTIALTSANNSNFTNTTIASVANYVRARTNISNSTNNTETVTTSASVANEVRAGTNISNSTNTTETVTTVAIQAKTNTSNSTNTTITTIPVSFLSLLNQSNTTNTTIKSSASALFENSISTTSNASNSTINGTATAISMNSNMSSATSTTITSTSTSRNTTGLNDSSPTNTTPPLVNAIATSTNSTNVSIATMLAAAANSTGNLSSNASGPVVLFDDNTGSKFKSATIGMVSTSCVCPLFATTGTINISSNATNSTMNSSAGAATTTVRVSSRPTTSASIVVSTVSSGVTSTSTLSTSKVLPTWPVIVLHNKTTSVIAATTSTGTTTTSTTTICGCSMLLHAMRNYAEVLAFESTVAAEAMGSCTSSTTTTSIDSETTSVATASVESSTTITLGRVTCSAPMTTGGKFSHAFGSDLLWKLTCNSGKMPEGGNVVICSAGNLSSVPACVPDVKCDGRAATPRVLANGAFISGNNCSRLLSHGETCTAKCVANATAVGSISCLSGVLHDFTYCVDKTVQHMAKVVTRLSGAWRLRMSGRPNRSSLVDAVAASFGLRREFITIPHNPTIGFRLLSANLHSDQPLALRRLAAVSDVEYSIVIPRTENVVSIYKKAMSFAVPASVEIRAFAKSLSTVGITVILFEQVRAPTLFSSIVLQDSATNETLTNWLPQEPTPDEAEQLVSRAARVYSSWHFMVLLAVVFHSS